MKALYGSKVTLEGNTRNEIHTIFSWGIKTIGLKIWLNFFNGGGGGGLWGWGDAATLIN